MYESDIFCGISKVPYFYSDMKISELLDIEVSSQVSKSGKVINKDSTLYLLIFFIGNIKMCLQFQFISFIHTDMTQAVEILPHLRQELI